MSTKIPGLKNIPPKTDRELKLALDDIKQALEIRLGLRGDPLDRAVTLRELEDSGIVKVRNKALGATSGITPPDEGGPPGFEARKSAFRCEWLLENGRFWFCKESTVRQQRAANAEDFYPLRDPRILGP